MTDQFTIWYGEDEDGAKLIAKTTNLRKYSPTIKKMYKPGLNFPDNPDAIQKILYLDQPDVIVTYGYPETPVLGIELCAEAPTGHDIFQRVARVVASAEFGTPFAFMFPKKKLIRRKNDGGHDERWDTYNPLPLKALLQIARFHKTPILAFFWNANQITGDPNQGYLVCDKQYPNEPSRADPEYASMVKFVNLVINYVVDRTPFEHMFFDPLVTARESWMWGMYHNRVGTQTWSPLTSCKCVPTEKLKLPEKGQKLPDHVMSRSETLVYSPESNIFRADPYAGNLAGIDYLECRNGPTVRHRYRNLAMEFRNIKFSDVAKMYTEFYQNSCPFRKGYGKADRYLTLHLREGCKSTKQKELRTFGYLPDILLLNDAALF